MREVGRAAPNSLGAPVGVGGSEELGETGAEPSEPPVIDLVMLIFRFIELGLSEVLELVVEGLESPL